MDLLSTFSCFQNDHSSYRPAQTTQQFGPEVVKKWAKAIKLKPGMLNALIDAQSSGVRSNFNQHGQGQVFDFFDKLNQDQKDQLLAELSKLDLARIQTLYKDAMEFDAHGQDQLGKLDPLDSYDSIETSSPAVQQGWQSAGLESIAAGECAALVLAGGAGTRLGFKYPKGMYDIQLPSRKSLYQLFVERLKMVAHLAGTRRVVPLYVMTSEGENHKQTVGFFRKNRFFGYGEENVVFFSQGTLPCMTLEGKIMLETGYHVGAAADGNGGIYGAIQKTGQIEDMRKRGVKYIHCFSVDNAIGKVCDPMFMGYCISRGSDVGNKVVWKAEPGEKVGVLGKRGGKNCVIEYSEMSKKDCELKDSKGKLVYGAGNICNHFYTVDFLSKVTDKDLIFHVARKKIKTPSADGQSSMTPTENTGIKLECFIFDPFHLATNMAILEGPRDEEFTPVKNAPGNLKDSPDSARAALTAQNVKWLRQAGIKVKPGKFQLEISSYVTYRGEGLQKLKSFKIDLSKKNYHFYSDTPGGKVLCK